MKAIDNRLRRLEGQLHTVRKNIATESSCDDVLPQLLAVRGAINGIVREYMETSLASCAQTSDEKKVKNLIKLLVKHV